MGTFPEVFELESIIFKFNQFICSNTKHDILCHYGNFLGDTSYE